MIKRIQNMWADALESGLYVQGKNRLKKAATTDQTGKAPTFEHCCLGVLCELYKKETGKGRWKKHKLSLPDVSCYEFAAGTNPYQENHTILPIVVQEWAGLQRRNPAVVHKKRTTTLASLNDIGITFGEIAKVIRKSKKL
jgi:uncharacterized protein YjiS (DUF1127 family)